MANEEIIRVRVDRYAHRKDDGWCVLDATRDTGAHVKLTGVVPENVQEGDTIEIAGRFVETDYGPQFRGGHLISHLSCRPDVIIAWLAHNIPHVGDARGAQLAKKYGGRIWGVIENTPDELTSVPGITPERVKEIVAAYAGVRTAREKVLKLTAAGLSIKDAAHIMAELGGDAFNILESDPYAALLRRRVPFETADKVALQLFKITPGDKRRIRAFAQRILFEKTYFEGHCYLMLFELVRETGTALKLKDPVVEAALVDYSDIVVHGKRCMLLDIDEAENVIATRVRELLATGAAT